MICRLFPDATVLALHVPNPMFVFAFEGVLFALTYNGDRFELFALLPRRKPRTSVSAAALSFFKELNLTSDGYSDSLAPFGRWHGFQGVCSDAATLGEEERSLRQRGFRRRYAPLFPIQSSMRTQVPNPMYEDAYEGE